MTTPQPAGPAAVVVTGLTKTFPGPTGERVRAVDGIDFTIRRGEVVAFLGPNGAGKTTTLDVVLGLATASAGDVRVLGVSPRDAVTSGRVAGVLQTGGLLADLTVAETVRMIASTFADHAPISDVIDRAGLAPIAHRRVSKCSGGEQQRLRFALALLPDPDLLILDEPTAGMDVTARRDFWDTMRAEATCGRTVLFATHYLEEADSFADRIIVIADGRVIADGPTEEIRARTTGCTVTAALPRSAAEIGPETGPLASLAAMAGVVAVRHHDHQVSVQVTAEGSDRVALALLSRHAATDLRISSGSLESAFVALTEDTTPLTESSPR